MRRLGHLSSQNNRKPSRGRRVQYVNAEIPRKLVAVCYKWYLAGLMVGKTTVLTGQKVPKIKHDRVVEKNVYRHKSVKIVNKIIHKS